MTCLGYALSSEEHGPTDLVDYAVRAEASGFDFAAISDHYHPWITRQGHSPYVWSVLGGIAEATESLRVGTGVTCPIFRQHPAIIAQAAATSATLLPDRFFLGVGTGENLNEHIIGQWWPPHQRRLEKLREALELIRRLWSGDEITHFGDHFTVANARLFTVPETPPPIVVAASGESMAEVAGDIGDGLMATSPDEAIISAYLDRAANQAPRYGQLTVCWDEDEERARQTALEWWPNTALPGQLGQDLPTPAHFEQVCSLLDEDAVTERIVCGPEIEDHLAGIYEFVEAGFDHVYIHQVGPNQDGFFEAYRKEVLPQFR